MQQIAKLFASLGFQIDTAQLSKFESLMKGAQGTMSAFARDVGSANIKLKTLMSRMDAVDAKFDKKSANAATGNLHRSVNKYITAFNRLIAEEPKIGGMMERIGIKSNRLANRLDNGTTSWTRYADAVKRARDKMREVTEEMQRRRSVAPPTGTGAPRGGSGNNGGSGGGSGGGGGSNTNNGGSTFFGGIPRFSKAFVGQMALGGALGSGYAVKELITTGREVIAMEGKLKAVSRGAADFESNLSYVRRTSQALAIDVVELGQSYASVFQTAKAKASTDQIQQMTTGLNSYFKALQMTPDQIKGSLKAIGQMFNKQKVMAEELTGQLGERAAGVVQFFADAAAGGDTALFFKMMQDGKIKPDIIFKVADAMGKAAENNGALATSLEMSASQQTRFNNEMKQMAAEITRVLDPTLSKLFKGLTALVEFLTPIFISLSVAISGIALAFEAIFSMNWKQWGLTIVVILGSIYTWLIAVMGAANGSIVALLGMRKVLLMMRAAIPLVAFLALLHVMGQIKQWYKDMENGIIRYNWIDVMGSYFELFFSRVGLGWAEMNLSMVRVIETGKALLALDWDRIKNIWGGGSEEVKNLGASNFLNPRAISNPQGMFAGMIADVVIDRMNKNNMQATAMKEINIYTTINGVEVQQKALLDTRTGNYTVINPPPLSIR